jgi:A/G-specific adenine glycosylase
MSILTGNSLVEQFQQKLISWYSQNGRSFYWRTHALDGWQWLMLELLLKKTRAETVEKEFPSLIAKYPRPETVVRTTKRQLQKDLEGLGLQRQRSEGLKLVAGQITREHNGRIPLEQQSLVSIRHVGLYISNAVLCFCYGQRRPIVDSNIARVLTRFNGLALPVDAREKWLWELAEKMLPQKKYQEYNYALLDLGALICRKNVPSCQNCCMPEICTYARKKGLDPEM